MMKKLNVKVLFLMIILSGLNQNLEAASPGSLDSSFGVAGKVVRDIFGNDEVRDIAIQKDGKIVTTGRNDSDDMMTVRFTIDGNLDTTFSGDGIVFTDVGFSGERGKSVKIQEDGKIVVAVSTLFGSGCGIVRYLPNGNPDTSFDTDGKVVLNDILCNDIAIQPDGKIVIAGNASLNSNSIRIFRLNENGSLDTTFATNGKLIFSGFLSTELFKVLIDTNNKIVAVGHRSTQQESLAVRVNPDGSFDTTFGGTGIVANDFISGFERFFDFVIDPADNSITAVGYFGSQLGLMIRRYTNSGNLDTSFSTDGRLEEFGIRGDESRISILSNRNILISTGSSTVFLKQYTKSGSPVTPFGSGGTVRINSSDFPPFARGSRVFGNQLVIGGSSSSNGDIRLARFNLSITPSQSGDFDGDGFGDIAVYRPSQGTWFILNSSDNSVVFKQFGLNGDIPIDGDFDGDGRNDFAIYRPSDGLWFVEKSSDSSNFARQFGTSSDKPATDDYDKDGRADLAFFRPSSGEWFIVRSSDGFNSFLSFPFGANGDIPIVKKGP